jgi:hypothetical protein
LPEVPEDPWNRSSLGLEWEMRLEIGVKVKHTKAGPGGWYCANRVHRFGVVVKIAQRVTIVWTDGTKSAVNPEQLTILAMPEKGAA